MGENEAVTDAAGIFAAQLIAAFPDAKCIMVVRDFDAWARSVDETMLSYLFSWFDNVDCFRWACLLSWTLAELANYLIVDGWLSACLIDPLVNAYSTRAMRKVFKGAMRCQAGEARKRKVVRKYYDENCATVQKLVLPDRLYVMRLGDGWEPLVSAPGWCYLPISVTNFLMVHISAEFYTFARVINVNCCCTFSYW